MGELINGRAPEEIKRGLDMHSRRERCVEDGVYCPYYARCKMGFPPVMKDALALIERLEAERDAALAKVPKWISVEERLPESTDVYMIHAVHRYNKNDGYRTMDVRMFFKDDFAPWQGLPDLYEVTHWMQLPEPPKEGE